jgi:hypothetical protein
MKGKRERWLQRVMTHVRITRMTTNTFTPERRELFLQVLADTCSPKAACAVVGIARSSAYYHREHDVDFKLAWDRCIDPALDAVLEESYRRAVVGHEEPVIHAGQVSKAVDPKTGEERPLTVTKYSDRLLEILMKWRYGDQLADKLRVRVEDTGLSAEALLAMPASERAALVSLLAKYSKAAPARERDDE